jgi:hypothetical protein
MTLKFRGSGTNKAQFKESILCLDTFMWTLCIFMVLVLNPGTIQESLRALLCGSV